MRSESLITMSRNLPCGNPDTPFGQLLFGFIFHFADAMNSPTGLWV